WQSAMRCCLRNGIGTSWPNWLIHAFRPAKKRSPRAWRVTGGPNCCFYGGRKGKSIARIKQRIVECDRPLEAHLKTMKNKAESGTKPQTPKAGKRAGGNAPQFDLCGEMYRVSGIDLTHIDGINVMI